MSDLAQEINKATDLKQALGLLVAAISKSGTIKVKKNSVTGAIKVAEGCVLAVGVGGARPDATATDLLLELLSLDDVAIEYEEIDEAYYPEGLTSTNLPIPMLLALKSEKPEQKTEGKAKELRTTGEILKVFGDGAVLEELGKNSLLFPEEAPEEVPEPAAESESNEATSEIAEPTAESESKEAASEIAEPNEADEEPTERLSTERIEVLPAQPDNLPAHVPKEQHNQLAVDVSYGLRPGVKSNEMAFPDDDFEKLRKNDSDTSADIYLIPDAEASKAADRELIEKATVALTDAELEKRSQQQSSSSLKASIHKSQVAASQLEGGAQYQTSRKILIMGAIVACAFVAVVLPFLLTSTANSSRTTSSEELLKQVAIERASSDSEPSGSSGSQLSSSGSSRSELSSSGPSRLESSPSQLYRSEQSGTNSASHTGGSGEAPFQLPQGSSGPSSGSAPLAFTYQKLHLSRSISKGKRVGLDTNVYSSALKTIENDRHAKKHQAELAAKMKTLSTELDAKIEAREPAKCEQAFVGMGVGLPGNMPKDGAERELYMSTKISSNTPLIVKGLHDSLNSGTLKAGDQILTIDGVSVDGLSIYQIQDKLSGTSGSEVKITYKSAEDNSVNTVKLPCNNKTRL